MESEFKRTMKLMWGHSEKVRFVCGCSLILLALFAVMAFVMEALFWGWSGVTREVQRISASYLGTASCMYFLFYSAYGNGKGILNGMGKWLGGSKLAKRVLVKGIIVNRLIVFGIMFVPCLVSRICLICRGDKNQARIVLFLVMWGVTYLISVVSNVSEIGFLAIFVVYMVAMWDKFWGFAIRIQMPVWGAVVVFLVCLIGGTVLEKLILERNYRNRKVARVSIMHTSARERR